MTAKLLREKFEADLKALQDECLHLEISDWTDYEFAPGHFAGMVKYCLRCEHILEKNSPAVFLEKLDDLAKRIQKRIS